MLKKKKQKEADIKETCIPGETTILLKNQSLEPKPLVSCSSKNKVTDGVEMHQDSSATSTETIEGTDVSVAVSSKAKAASKIFVCNDCAYTSKWKANVRSHCRTWNHSHSYEKEQKRKKQKLLECALCNFKTKEKVNLIKHKRSKHGLGRFLKPKAEADQEDKTKTPASKDILYMCHDCPVTSYCKQKIVDHATQKSHEFGVRFCCIQCPRKFMIQADLVAHRLTHEAETAEMSKDIKVENSPEKLKVTLKRLSADCESFYGHQSSYSPLSGSVNEEVDDANGTDVRKFKCSDCSYSSNRKDKLVQHTLRLGHKHSYKKEKPGPKKSQPSHSVSPSNQSNAKLPSSDNLKYSVVEGFGVPSEDIDNSMRFKCLDCTYSTDTRKNLHKHASLMDHKYQKLKSGPKISLHSGDGVDHATAECHVKTGANYYLQDKRFKLDMCTYSTNRIGDHQRHKKTYPKPNKYTGVGKARRWKTEETITGSVEKTNSFKYCFTDGCGYKTQWMSNIRNHCRKFGHEHSSVHLAKIARLEKTETAMKDQEVMFQCKECDYSTRVKASMFSHMDSKSHLDKTTEPFDHTLNQFNCTPCNYSAKSQFRMFIHMKSLKHKQNTINEFSSQVETKENTTREDFAPIETPNKENIVERSDETFPENADGSYLCRPCNFHTPVRRLMQIHFKSNLHLKRIVSMTGPETFSCDPCGFSAKVRSNLFVHLKGKSHSSVFIERCKVGKKVLESARQESEDSDRAEVTSDATDQSSVKCEFCAFRTADRDILENHTKTHPSTSPSTGTIFAATAVVAADSAAVLLPPSATSEQLYTCSACNFATDIGIKMLKHTLSLDHKNNAEDTELLSCQKCNYSARSGVNFARHLNSKGHNDVVSEKRSLGCRTCGFFANSKKIFDAHIRSKGHKKNFTNCIGSVLPFRCDFCNFDSDDLNRLNIHLKTESHKIKIEINGSETGGSFNAEHSGEKEQLLEKDVQENEVPKGSHFVATVKSGIREQPEARSGLSIKSIQSLMKPDQSTENIQSMVMIEDLSYGEPSKPEPDADKDGSLQDGFSDIDYSELEVVEDTVEPRGQEDLDTGVHNVDSLLLGHPDEMMLEENSPSGSQRRQQPGAELNKRLDSLNKKYHKLAYLLERAEENDFEIKNLSIADACEMMEYIEEHEKFIDLQHR